ncbi:hypothetical protein Amal_03751 [Acetobacter malorum]|uniref:Uncharacterized protein n=1 Tax=Acetobacter malorum TaxID=178901 RepID=A0A177G6U8_9PROT|nr:hypothetical protein Amal_03751 [Acetobacter malorum]
MVTVRNIPGNLAGNGSLKLCSDVDAICLKIGQFICIRIQSEAGCPVSPISLHGDSPVSVPQNTINLLRK